MNGEIRLRLDQLRHSITVLEGQRAALGNAVVEPALAALRQQIEALETQAAAVHAPTEERRLITVHPDGCPEIAWGIWTYLQEHGTKGMTFPVWAYQTCADIFDALGEPERSRTAVEAGYRELMTLAEKISDSEWRASFLENVPEHRAIVESWERLPAERS
jgi:hypothetical protein